jgi:energy-coupling factor transport system substrate-specific component
MNRFFWPVVSLAMLALLALLFYWFERRRPSAERLVMLASLSAVSAAGRGLFVAIPSVQPSSFIIIMAGITMGKETGFMTGALTALLSGLWLGIGPWTPWQMLAWGLMGGMAGMLRKPLMGFKPLRIGYGLVWGFLFGWIMNFWMLMSVESAEPGWRYLLMIYTASFLFDGMHAVFNGLLIWLGGDGFIKALHRLALKYGLIKR